MTDLTGTRVYQYDLVNRLTSATHPTLAAESYAYDAAGNRLASATDSNYAYDPAGRLTAGEGASYTYDNNGNLITGADSKGATAYSYDFENRLVDITFPDGTTASYKYDALGHRIEKNVNGTITRYLYDGYNLLAEFDANNQLQARYTHGPAIDQLLIMERGGADLFLPSGQDRLSGRVDRRLRRTGLYLPL